MNFVPTVLTAKVVSRVEPGRIRKMAIVLIAARVPTAAVKIKARANRVSNVLVATVP